MKRTLQFMGSFIGTLAGCYLVASFSQWNINAGEWDEGVRNVTWFMGIIVSIGVSSKYWDYER